MNEEGAWKEIARAIARQFGTPCYIYSFDQVRDHVQRLRSVFGNRFRISYAVKSNPNAGILRRLRGLVDTLDVSSGGEVSRALHSDWDPTKLSFTGPGKTRAELTTSVQVGVGEIVIESVGEAELLNDIASQARKSQRVLLRLAPSRVPRGFGLTMSGKPCQFGIDEEDVDAAVRIIQGLTHLHLCGLHIYSGTQCLNAEAIVENYEIFIDIFRRVCQTHQLSPRKLVFGSGIGIPYHEQDTAVDLAALAAKTNPALDELKSQSSFCATEFVLETGRYLIGEAGVYVTQVIRKKHSRGIDICICDGGMNHHLGAAGHLGTLIQRNYPIFKITGEDDGPEQAYNLVGPLCTTIDTLGRQVKFKGLQPGDLIGIGSSGAYGVTASPIHFISHTPPKEIIVETIQGRLRVDDSTEFGGSKAEAFRGA
jgi:diaminopimelate decarboxylase